MNDHLLSTQAKPALYFRRKIPLKDDRETFISPKSFISAHHKYDPVKLEPPIELKSVVHRVDKGTKDEVFSFFAFYTAQFFEIKNSIYMYSLT